MKYRVLYYRLGFRPKQDVGTIRIFLENKKHYDFTDLSAQEFNALVNVLSNEPVFWDNNWLFTSTEIVK